MCEEFEGEVFDAKQIAADRDELHRKLNMEISADASELCAIFQKHKLDAEDKKEIVMEMMKEFKRSK